MINLLLLTIGGIFCLWEVLGHKEAPWKANSPFKVSKAHTLSAWIWEFIKIGGWPARTAVFLVWGYLLFAL